MKTYDELKSELPIKRGDIVTVRKGAKVRTAHPQGSYLTKKSYKVKMFDVAPGYEERKPEVCWVGKGSYWFYTDIDNCNLALPNAG